METMKRILYVTALVTLILFAILFWWAALTLPAISATAPAIIAVFLTVCTYLTWRVRGRVF